MTQRPHHLSPAKETVRAVWVYKDFSEPSCPYKLVGIGVSCEGTARVLRQHGIWTDLWATRSADDLDRRLREAEARGGPPITHVNIGAMWIEANALMALAERYRETVFTVVNHSTFSFLHADRKGDQILQDTLHLQRQMHNVSVAGNSRKFTEPCQVVYGVPVALLPNLYNVQTIVPRSPYTRDGHLLRVGCFGFLRPWKNVNTAAVAALEIKERLRCDLEFHVNCTEPNGSVFLSIKQLYEHQHGARLVNHPWLPWPKFLALVRHMDLLLQVSYTETFNQVTADGIHEGVPSVVSDAIDWAPRSWKAHFDDPSDCARVGVALLHDPQAARDGLAALEQHHRQAVPCWLEYLTRVR